MRKWVNTAKRGLPAAVLLFSLLGIWELISRTANLPQHRLPAPSSIGLALANNIQLLTGHAGATLTAVAAGMLIAVVLAAALAVSMNRWYPVKQALYPLLVISQTIPIFVLAPLFLIWFGLGLHSKIVVVALVCFFPMVVNLVEGLEQVDPEALDLMKVMQAGPGMIFRSVQLPAVLPYFYTGLKISVTYSVMGAVIGEWLGARAGLGVFMLRSYHSYKTANVFAAVIVIVILSLVLFKLTELLAWLTMPWQRTNINKLEE
jgi:putative hydroxymethylpyrimidine transport system permease protein